MRKMQKEPLVSINIVTYNRCENFKKSLDSVINQAYQNLEIIISDNNSNDNTEALCREYATKDSRIRYFKHDENIGLTNNLNFASEKINGEYVLWLCDNETLNVDDVEKCIEFAAKHPEYTAIFFSANTYNKNCELNQNNLNCRINKYLHMNCHNICNGFFKTEIIKKMLKADGYIQKDRIFENWVFTIKYLVAGKAGILYFEKSDDKVKSIGNIDYLTYDKLLDNLTQSISDAILNDKFFELYLDEKAKKKLIKTVRDVIFIGKLLNKIKEFKKNPYFMFKKNFWIRTWNRIKR